MLSPLHFITILSRRRHRLSLNNSPPRALGKQLNGAKMAAQGPGGGREPAQPRVLSASCPDEACHSRLFFPSYDLSVECPQCGQRHDRAALRNVEEVSNPGIAFHSLIRNILVGTFGPDACPPKAKRLGSFLKFGAVGWIKRQSQFQKTRGDRETVFRRVPSLSHISCRYKLVLRSPCDSFSVSFRFGGGNVRAETKR